MSIVRRLHHASLAVPTDRAERTIDFYEQILGLERIDIPQTLGSNVIAWFLIGGGELHLMTEAAPDNDASRRHLCFEVSDVAAMRSVLESSGAVLSEAPQIPGRPRFFCPDPAGNLLEFTELRDDSE